MTGRYSLVISGWCLFALLVFSTAPATVDAQLYRFGKNKVQFDEFDWQRLETTNFDVYFYEEERDLAAFAARAAQESYRAVEQQLAHSVQRRIPLILYSSHIYFEQTNVIPGMLPEGVAGFTEFLKGRVALPLSGSFAEFERVLHHELVHVFQFDKVRRVLHDRGITDMYRGPLWFSEGLAEHLSGTWDSTGDMIVRDALFAGRLVPIARMNLILGTFQMYKEGQSICDFMAMRYGPDIFARLLDNWWRAETFEEIFAATTGDELSELDSDWGYDLRKRYLPDIEDADPPSRMAEALTKTGYNLKPSVIPGSQGEADSTGHYVFFRNSQGYTRIARARIDGEGKPEIVVEGERRTDFESLHPIEASLAVAPDGRRLAFVAKRNGRDRLFLWDLETGQMLREHAYEELVALSSPTWSPDGHRLALAGARRGGQMDLFVVDAESGDLQVLTDDLAHDRDPDWHPVDDLLVFSSDRASQGREGIYHLYVHDLATGQTRPLTTGVFIDQQPAWSPDGQWLAFSSNRDGMFDVYGLRVDLDAEHGDRVGLRRLSQTLTGIFDPDWTPDGGGLLVTGFEAARFHIFRLDLEADQLAEPALRAVEADSSLRWDTQWVDLEDDALTTISLREYERRMSIDVAQSQISQDPLFGTSGGIQVALSDVLGNDQYYFILSHISGSQTGFFDGLNLAFGRRQLARQLNVGWGVFRLNDRFSSTFGRFVREKRTGGYVELSYPFNRQDRLETRLSLRHSDIDRQFEGRKLDGWLVSNHLAFTHDNSLWVPTGPLEGTRYSLGVGQTVDFKRSRPFNTTVFADLRHYQRLSQRTSLAIRYLGLHSRGNVPESYALGGSWTLRGYAWRSMWGRNLILANHELRFPLLDAMVFAFPFGTIDFRAFRGALFVDAGNAWNDEFGDWRGSIGAGTRIALGGVFVLRLDASRRTDFRSVNNGTRWDFFFGWDY
ncbi:MAG: BamA/TamA family outer membrane protein [Gemmatimonadetes bacterium]|jgi:hypothetical protein|nr:BamA/TamA family outer membrane protein [Gemmatimonadota bacterium]